MDVKYPDIVVKLSEGNGNAFAILGTMFKALKRNNVSEQEIEQFKKEAMAGDYDNLLQTCMRWVTVE